MSTRSCLLLHRGIVQQVDAATGVCKVRIAALAGGQVVSVPLDDAALPPVGATVSVASTADLSQFLWVVTATDANLAAHLAASPAHAASAVSYAPTVPLTGTTVQTALDQAAAWPLGRRNLLDNSQFMINQRGITGQTIGSSNTRGCDRWYISNSGVGTMTLASTTLTAFGVELPLGRPRPALVQYVNVTASEAAGSIAAGDVLEYVENVEGVNVQHLGWGTPNALPVTISFDVYSTVTATYPLEILSLTTTSNRGIHRLFTAVGGQWTTVVVTIPGDTANKIDPDTSGRFRVAFFLAAGSNYTSSPLQTSWGTLADASRCAGITNNFPGTNNNVFAVTNVQAEPGLMATPYEVRSWAEELAACQRQAFFPGWNIASANYVLLGTGWGLNTTVGVFTLGFPVSMRGAPTWSMNGATAGQFGCHDRVNLSTTIDVSLAADSIQSASTHTGMLLVTVGGVGSQLIAFRPYDLLKNSGQAANPGWVCEI